MKFSAQTFILLDALTFIILLAFFFLLFKSNLWFERSKLNQKKDNLITSRAVNPLSKAHLSSDEHQY